jgi:hypothetical protein
MATGLKGDIYCAIFGARYLREGIHFGVTIASTNMPAPRNDFVMQGNDATYSRIRTGAITAALCQLQSKRHHLTVYI